MGDLGFSIRPTKPVRAVLWDETDPQFRRIHNSQAIINRTLPVEMLQEIFEHVIFNEPVSAYMRRAIVLSGVCENWRSICISMRKAWSNIECLGGYPGTLSITFLKLCLERSGSSPTRIRIDDTFARYDRTKEGVLEVTEAKYQDQITSFLRAATFILADLTRCYQLTLKICHSESFNHLIPLQGSMPALQKLHCDISINILFPHTPNSRLAASQSSWLLEELTLSWSAPYSLDDFRPTSLVKLDIGWNDAVTIDELVHFINRTTKLRRLRVLTSLSTPSNTIIERPASFTPHLHKLSTRGGTLLPYLHNWNAPLLSRLTLWIGISRIDPIVSITSNNYNRTRRLEQREGHFWMARVCSDFSGIPPPLNFTIYSIHLRDYQSNTSSVP